MKERISPNDTLYDHADERAWSDSRLAVRRADLERTEKVPHTEERLARIRLELACVAFEQKARVKDAERRQAEIDDLEAHLNEPEVQGVEDEEQPEDTRH